jgi:cell division protein ZipA
MDVTILRIILILLGGALIVGIYLWERRKRDDARVHAVRREQESRLEPTLGGPGAEREPEVEYGETAGLDHDLHELQELVREERPVRPAARPAKIRKEPASAGAAETRQQDLFADDAISDTDHYKQSGKEIPTLILQINVVARDDDFEGLDIVRAIQGEQLELGDMDIFHRHNDRGGKGPVLFSMASMVKPGIFPRESMEEFRTPGLTLFAQLPGPRDGLELFSEMHSTAEHLALELNGELQDETHSRLTKQTVEHIRSQILEHQRRVQLAKSRLK